MSMGTLYGIGVGPGDPELLTVKAARLLGRCRHVVVPRSRQAADSVALDIARPHLRPDAQVHEMVFPMSSDAELLRRSWQAAARQVLDVLQTGEDCCFLTLGDALLYSTYIYLLRELRALAADVKVQTIPGITAFSAAAALASFPIGEAKGLVTIVPAADDMTQLQQALDRGGTVVLMKIGKRLTAILDELESRGLLGSGVFVSRATMPDQHIETDLSKLRGAPEDFGYLSILIVHASGQAPVAGSQGGKA